MGLLGLKVGEIWCQRIGHSLWGKWLNGKSEAFANIKSTAAHSSREKANGARTNGGTWMASIGHHRLLLEAARASGGDWSGRMQKGRRSG